MPSYWNWLEYARYDGMAKFPYWDNPAELEWWRLEVWSPEHFLIIMLVISSIIG